MMYMQHIGGVMKAAITTAPDLDHTLCKALFKATDYMGLKQSALGKIIGLDRSSVTRLKQRGTLNPESKAGELATYVIRIFRSLFALMGDNEEAIRHWMKTNNKHLNGKPSELIQQAQGLVQVMGYLDSMRGKV